jgi:NAD(P)-dependent dehydrogenase (short-subunit alcohol dehydrogenase family)
MGCSPRTKQKGRLPALRNGCRVTAGFQDKVAIVTGGASGLGRALCHALARRGALAVVADVNGDGSRRVGQEIVDNGGRATAVDVDVSQAASVRELVAGVVRDFGRIDLIINNAGIIVGGEVRDMSLEHWHSMIQVNLLGVVYGTTAAYKQMVRQGHGQIVNISSLSGLISLPIYTGYATTKHAVVGLSTSLRAEAAKLGVKVSVACPGRLRTALSDTAIVVNARREDIRTSINQDRLLLDPAVAAEKILLGARRNRRIIVFPLSSRILWLLERLWPGSLRALNARIVENFRVARIES